MIAFVPGEAIRTDVAVMGGGLAGLSTAIGFARRGRRVCVRERDATGAGASEPDLVFDGWVRSGVAHFRQPHNFLGLGRRTLLDEAPDVLERVLADGAFENRQFELAPGDPLPGDESLVSICVRRPVFESAPRAAAEAEADVRIEGGARITGLLGAPASGNGRVRVTGARTTDGRTVEADLVVDALGRTSQVRTWLEELGSRPMAERRNECGLLYYSRHFRLRPGVEMPSLPSLLRGPRGETGYLVFVVFLGDNGTFALVLMIPPCDRELRALKSETAYMAVALAIPPLVPWIHPDRSEPITPVLPMGSLQNLHRSLVVDGEPVATGIQPIGDALCHTNPTFALGASLSITHGFTLAEVVASAEDGRDLALSFEHTAGVDAAARFDAVSDEDRDRIRLWRGEQIDIRDPDDSMALFLRLTAYPASIGDPNLFRAVARRVNALDPPDALGRDEALVARARVLAGETGTRPPLAPTRDELLALIARASG